MDNFISTNSALNPQGLRSYVCLLNPLRTRIELENLKGTKIRIFDRSTGMMKDGTVVSIFTDVIGDSFLHEKVTFELQQS